MRRSTLFFAAFVASTPVLAAALLPEPEPATIDLGRPLVHYATIARPDGSFRRLWIDEAALAVVPGEQLPNGTAIALETFFGPEARATVFIKEKRDGAWVYGSFEPDRPDWGGQRPRTACHACHIDAAADLTFTLPSIARFASTRAVERFICAESGRVPCGEDVYRTAAH